MDYENKTGQSPSEAGNIGPGSSTPGTAGPENVGSGYTTPGNAGSGYGGANSSSSASAGWGGYTGGYGGYNGYSGYSAAPYAPKEAAVFEHKDKIFSVLMLIGGFLFIDLTVFRQMGAGVTLFAIYFVAAVFWYLKVSGFDQTKESVAYLCVIFASAVNFSLFDNSFLKGWLFLFLIAILIYWVCTVTEQRVSGSLSVYALGDIVNQGLSIPFSNFGCCAGALAKNTGGKGVGKNILIAATALFLFLPVLIVVTNLLMQADDAFEYLVIDQLLDRIFSLNILRYAVELFVGIPAAFYLYGAVYGNVRDRCTTSITEEKMQNFASNFSVVPKAAVYTSLIALNGIYLLFFLSQAAYLFSAFESALPATMTYAEYARRGFFELCYVSSINLAVLAGAQLLLKRTTYAGDDEWETPVGFKWIIIVLSGFTIMLSGIGISKMIMYIEFCGFTLRRIYTTWFMAMLLMLFLIVILRQFINFNGTRICAAVTAVSFLLLCYANVDGQVAKYNIERYEAGTLESLNVYDMRELSAGAAPYIIQWYESTEDEEVKGQLEKFLQGEAVYGLRYLSPPLWTKYFNDDFRAFNMQAGKAEGLLRGLLEEDGGAESLSDELLSEDSDSDGSDMNSSGNNGEE